ncbi:MAG: ABC transporter permease [Actinomycetota bacterium]
MTLTARTAETMIRNRLTMAIMLGSPLMVIAMFAVLFRPGVFDPTAPSPTAAIMVAFWVAFGAFFFGLTYGLLQITPEVPLMRRERQAGVGAGLQILSKLTALTPVLIVINLAMLGVLVTLDRLPALSAAAAASIALTLGLDAVAALALGLLASSLVRSTAQAALALPMLCFPAVLFSGAVLPVEVMATAGRGISAAMSDRWAFELIGRDLGLRELFANDPSPLGPSLLAEFGQAWTHDHGEIWALLTGFAVAASIGAWIALDRRCRASERSVS